MAWKKTCFFCKGTIDLEKERYVLLGTYEVANTIEESHFHIICWKRYWDRKIQESISNRMKLGVQGIKKVVERIGINNENEEGKTKTIKF